MRIDGNTFVTLCSGAILDVSSAPRVYDKEYFAKYCALCGTPISDNLVDLRRRTAERHGTGVILDYGCGYAPIVRADRSGRWYGYDINPLCSQGLGPKWDGEGRIERYPTTCFFDSLEHSPDPLALLRRCPHRIVVSIPIYPERTWENLTEWRHYRPREHFLYCTTAGFNTFLNRAGFTVRSWDWTECALGRQNIALVTAVR